MYTRTREVAEARSLQEGAAPDLYSFQDPSCPQRTPGDPGLCLDSNLPLYNTSFCLSQHKAIFQPKILEDQLRSQDTKAHSRVWNKEM